MMYDMMRLEVDFPALGERRSTWIKILSVWVLYGGYSFFIRMAIDPMPVNEDNQRRFETRGCYQGPIFGLQRWDFWQERLSELSGDPTITEEARDLGLRAADLMAALARNIR